MEKYGTKAALFLPVSAEDKIPKIVPTNPIMPVAKIILSKFFLMTPWLTKYFFTKK